MVCCNRFVLLHSFQSALKLMCMCKQIQKLTTLISSHFQFLLYADDSMFYLWACKIQIQQWNVSFVPLVSLSFKKRQITIHVSLDSNNTYCTYYTQSVGESDLFHSTNIRAESDLSTCLVEFFKECGHTVHTKHTHWLRSNYNVSQTRSVWSLLLLLI